MGVRTGAPSPPTFIEEARTQVEEVELDDGVWEVDDATAADGQKHDLTLDGSFAITGREPD